MDYTIMDVKKLSEQMGATAIKAILDKDFARHVLVMQPWIRDSSITVGDLIGRVLAETREKIVVRRFTRFALGEEIV